LRRPLSRTIRQRVEPKVDYPAPSAARTIQQSLERIRLNAAWIDRNRAPLEAWFAGR